MTFVCRLYILIIIFAENKGNSHAQCVSVVKDTEVVRSPPQLHLPECSPLLNTANELIPERTEHDKTNYEVLNEDLNCLLTTSKVYLVERSTMQLTRKLLEHSDLVMYMKGNHRPVHLLDADDYHLANVLEFPEPKVMRRRRSKNNKHLSNKEKKKKKKKRAHKDHPEHRKTQKQRIRDATGHAVAHKTHKLKKKENKSRDMKCYLKQHQSLCISISFVLLFIILCLVTAYYLHRRSRLKARGTRFKYNWAANKEDKDTLTDYVEWDDEAVCSCSDVDIGSAIKCPICNRFYQKSKDKEKKKRFSFLQKSFQNKKKEKNLENRDWKCVKRKNIGTIELKNIQGVEQLQKADKKAILKKQEKFPSAFQGDQQCGCCKCDLHIRDKMIREKKEHKRKVLQKLKTKKRKEKKRRKDEIRKTEKYANVCFKDNCK